MRPVWSDSCWPSTRFAMEERPDMSQTLPEAMEEFGYTISEDELVCLSALTAAAA